jgi:hypothetical protein
MPVDPPSQRSRSASQADFTYKMTVNAIKIQDTGKGAKTVAEDLEAVLRKIETWHQEPVAGFRIIYRDTEGNEHPIQWDGKVARVVKAER